MTEQLQNKSSPGLIITGISVFSLLAALTALWISYEKLETGTFVLLTSALFVSHGLLLVMQLFKSRQHKRLINAAINVMQGKASGIEPASIDASKPDNTSFTDQFNEFVSTVSNERLQLEETQRQLSQITLQLNEITDSSNARQHSWQESAVFIRSSVEQMLQAIKTAVDVSSQTNALARQSEQEGSNGKLAMTEAITGVMMLGESVNEAGQIINTLGEDSKSIGGIIEVIRGVAEQTNLLALNAAIEAARAGEQGRGFAVVADEVRSLASQTQSSAQQINDIINRLLGHVEQANGVIQTSMQYADKSDELMENITISYSELVGHMSEVKLLASQLDGAIGEEKTDFNILMQHLQNFYQGSSETEQMDSVNKNTEQAAG